MPVLLVVTFTKIFMKRLVLVIGVHRSGTSVLTKGLETMGISLGDTLISPNIYNEKGYWEDLDFHALNLEMLNSFEDRFRFFLSITDEEATTLCEKGFLAKASQLLRTKFSSSHHLGIKNPRFSILLPFWKRVFLACGVLPSFVIALRNPFSVAAGHNQFKNQHPEQPLWTWVSYLLSCLEESEGYERIIVDYDELLKKPTHQITRIAHTLRFNLNPTLLQSYIHNDVDLSLRHFHEEKKSHSDNSFWGNFALEIYQNLFLVATEQASFEEIQSSQKKWKKQLAPMKSHLALEEKNISIIQDLLEKNKHLHEANVEHLKMLIELNKTMVEKCNLIAQLYQAMEQRP